MADAEAVSREITSRLRRNEGLIASKFAECPTILEVLGTDDPVQAHERFVAAVEQLPDDKYTSALKNALRLDKSLKENVSARRGVFGTTYSVSEETVKTWENRAIEVLAQTLVAKPTEHIEEISIVFFVEDKKILYKSETRFWIDGPVGSVGNVRLDTRNIPNEGGMLLSCGLYQLHADEQPSALELYLVFPDNQLPTVAFSMQATDIFNLVTNDCSKIDLGRPNSALAVLGDEWRPEGGPAVFEDMSCYMRRFEQPKQGEIYGVAWFYG